MANVPQTNITGIQGSEGLLGQLFSYLYGLNGGTTSTPSVNPQIPTMLGLKQAITSANNGPMQLQPGGGINPGATSTTQQSSTNLSANPARSAIRQQQIAANTGIAGQNAQLLSNNLFNNMSMEEMINSLMGNISNSLGQIGDYPPQLRGQAQSTAASGTGGGSNMLSMFGF